MTEEKVEEENGKKKISIEKFISCMGSNAYHAIKELTPKF
jgi:hypothetical protein